MLNTKLDSLPSYNVQHPYQPTSSPKSTTLSNITISTLNCCGLQNAIPYIYHLIENGSDVIILSEHWLWPYNIGNLSSLHPEFVGFGYCDSRLNESCSLSRGCGGIGVIWRKPYISPLYLKLSPIVYVPYSYVSLLQNFFQLSQFIIQAQTTRKLCIPPTSRNYSVLSAHWNLQVLLSLLVISMLTL